MKTFFLTFSTVLLIIFGVREGVQASDKIPVEYYPFRHKVREILYDSSLGHLANHIEYGLIFLSTTSYGGR